MATAAQIRALLDTWSPTLARHQEAVQQGLRAADGEEGAVPASTYAGIEGMRAFYRGLAGKVRAVPTADPAKGEVLAALKRVDAGLASFAVGLQGGISEEARAGMFDANRRLVRASNDLRRVRERLG